jgi:Arc/MetJ family transcription regulator
MSKTTIDIPEPLLAEAKEIAAREGTTLRALVEAGLRMVVERRGRGKEERFELRDASVDGDGLQTEFRDAGWERLRDAAYDGRGA